MYSVTNECIPSNSKVFMKESCSARKYLHIYLRQLIIIPILSISVSSAKANSVSYPCTTTSRLLQFIHTSIQASSDVRPRELTCNEKTQIESSNQESIEITTGRKNGKAVICMGFSRDVPCVIILADLENNADPTKTLTELFKIRDDGRDKQLKETVERLFIRPAAIIR